MPPRLKSLELQGYKTFASRNEFIFAETVTAIVGPNGSGKSNIVDSLRWVLGEQSYNLLRGKKTEDMIFAGSEHRARAGMASCTVTFDNSDNWLPIDFTEVALTRRATRDGQNEYLLNGQKVRLRDISELLARAGLAERTYTIIGQGLVDAALSLRADERRRLFEEAAGIGLYRTRREEALRRLETTQRNLERVQDILAELQPRLKSLEKQARRAHEYEQIRTDLHLLLREWYGYHWHRTQDELVHAQHASQAQEQTLQTARARQAEYNTALTSLREQINALRARLSGWHRDSAQQHARREDLNRQLAVSAERARALAEQNQTAQAESVRLQEDLALQQQRRAAAAQETARHLTEAEEARAQTQAAEQALRQRLEQRQRIENTLQDLRKQIGAAQNRRGALQARLSERQQQAEKQQTDLQTARAALQTAQTEVQTAQTQQQQAQTARRTAARKLEDAEIAYQEARERQTTAQTARQTAQDSLAAASAQTARLQAQLDVLEQAEQNLAGYAESAKLLLQAARQNRLSPQTHALSSLLEVPAELETAIAAALGEYLDAVLLSTAAESDTALQLLDGKPLRAALLPIESLHPTAPAPSPMEADGDLVGRAANLVGAPPQARPALDLLLGQTFIVRHRAAARRLLPQMPPGTRLVTLRGEVFHTHGAILTRTEAKSAPLSRPRQRRELTEALQAAQAQTEQIQTQLARWDKELNHLQRETNALQTDLQTARRADSEAAAAADRARSTVEQAQKQAAWQQQQIQRLESEMLQASQQAAQLHADQTALEAQLTQLHEAQRTQQAALAALPLDELQQQRNHWHTQQALATRAVEDAQRRQREAESALMRLQQMQQAAQARQTQAQNLLTNLETERETLRRAEQNLASQIEALRQTIEPAETELTALETRLQTLQTEDDAARQTLSLAEHRYAQARIALNKQQESLESLRRRIEDDFGLVAFNYATEISGPVPLPMDGMVEPLPVVREIPAELEENLKRQRAQLRRMGAINPEAQREYDEVSERYQFLTAQVTDLRQAESDLREVVQELDGLMQQEFQRTFDAVAVEFRKVFTRLFGGGSARLILTNPQDLSNTGIDIEARLPGRRAQGLSLLSGGERSLTAVALVFALLKTSPTPFCVLDEVDAMLDEANVGRFRDLLRELSANTQFVIITHNRNTVQVADVIYGITMGRDLASRVVSLRLDEVAALTGVQG